MTSEVSVSPTSAEGVGRPLLRLLLALVALAAAVAGQYWLVIAPQPALSGYAWGLAVVAFLLLYFAAADGRALPGAGVADVSPAQARLWLGMVLALGAFCVVYRVGTYPPGLNHDAAWEGLYALRVLQGEPFTPYTSEAWGRETMTFYFRAVSAWLLGPTVLAVQAPGMLAGWLTLPFFYGWTRQMFGTRLALAATAFLAVSGWHLVFSRTGWRSDFQPLFMAATCYYFFRGVRDVRSVDFLLAGLSLALTLNTYNGSRLFPAVFALWSVLVVVQSWRVSTFFRRYGLGIAFFSIAFLLAVAPLTIYALENWEIFMGRAAALRGASSFSDALVATAGLFHYAGNGDDFFIREPALEFPAAVLMTFGLLWALLRWRDERAQFLLLGLAINLIPGLVSKPNLNRNIGTMIFAYVFVGLGGVFLARQVQRLSPRLGAAILIGFCGLAFAVTYDDYLDPTPRHIWGYYPETTVVGRYVDEMAPKYAIWVGGANFPRDSITYLSYQGGPDPMERSYVWLDDVGVLLRQPLSAPAGKGMAFVLADEGQARQVLQTLQRRFPQHEVQELRYPPGDGKVFAKALLVQPGVAPVADTPDAAPAAAAAVAAAAAPAGELRQPRAIAFLSTGELAVADFGNHRVQILAADLRPLRQWGGEGIGPGEFREPSDLAVGPGDEIYVTDTWNGRVQRFAADGTFIGQTSEALYGPRGVAVGADGTVFVADTGNNRIVKFSRDLQLLASFGSRGSEAGQVLEPVGLRLGAEGTLWIADNGNSRLQEWSADGRPLRSLPIDGWGSAVYSEPHLDLDGSGRIWVTVPRMQRLRAYLPNGDLAVDIGAEGLVGLDLPMGVAVDPQKAEVVVVGLSGAVRRLRQAGPGAP